MIEIRWSNDHVDRAPTWQALLDQVRETQWRDMDEEQFRLVMAKRAIRWSGVEILPDGPPDEFFYELQLAKLIVIEKHDEVQDPTA